jgi:hypothetical protein
MRTPSCFLVCSLLFAHCDEACLVVCLSCQRELKLRGMCYVACACALLCCTVDHYEWTRSAQQAAASALIQFLYVETDIIGSEVRVRLCT